MRVKLVEVHARFLEMMLKEATPLRSIITRGLPDDAQIVGMYIVPERARVLQLHVTSQEFPDLPDGTFLEPITPIEHVIFWPETIRAVMEAWMKEEGIEYRGPLKVELSWENNHATV